MSLTYHEGYSGGLPGYPCTDSSPGQGVSRQVHILLLVTLRCIYVLAKLFLDNTLSLGGSDLAAQFLD
jgi:hypothetical protein